MSPVGYKNNRELCFVLFFLLTILLALGSNNQTFKQLIAGGAPTRKAQTTSQGVAGKGFGKFTCAEDT